MRIALSSALLSLSLVVAAAAQTTNPIRYPQANTDGSSGQIIPLGFSTSSGNFDEGRWQQLIQARYLPSTGGVILGLEVLSQASLTATYPTLQITMSLVPPGGTLSTTFANNLPQPVPVFSHLAHTIVWTARQWQTIPLDIPFVYDGVSDVVVEIQKTFDRVATPPPGLAHHQTDGDPSRPGLPIARNTFGTLGSGALARTTSTSSSVPMKMGFRFADLPTFTLLGPRGGANSRVFAVGGSFDASLNGQPFALFGSLIAFGWAAPPIAVPGIGGLVMVDLPSTTAYASGAMDASGVATTTWSIPNDPGLVGVMVVFQGVSTSVGAGVVMTNGIDCVINS
ncbi:MAG: hypothetical protein HZB39_11265 [Planctomycetes bacterium]|nr:hypothetical protein [Planctomycetota bacterium]